MRGPEGECLKTRRFVSRLGNAASSKGTTIYACSLRSNHDLCSGQHNRFYVKLRIILGVTTSTVAKSLMLAKTFCLVSQGGTPLTDHSVGLGLAVSASFLLNEGTADQGAASAGSY
jgi:hypothetical protein